MDTKTRFKKINFSGLVHCRKAQSIQYKIILMHFHYSPISLSSFSGIGLQKFVIMKFFTPLPLPIFCLMNNYIHGQVSPVTLNKKLGGVGQGGGGGKLLSYNVL